MDVYDDGSPPVIDVCLTTVFGSIISLCFAGKETLDVSSQVQVTCSGFFQHASVRKSDHHLLAAELFKKYRDHSLDTGADHAWVDVC